MTTVKFHTKYCWSSDKKGFLQIYLGAHLLYISGNVSSGYAVSEKSNQYDKNKLILPKNENGQGTARLLSREI
jgi:hypothetical protein